MSSPPTMIITDTCSPPSVPIACKKCHLSFGVEAAEAEAVAVPVLAMPSTLFLPDLDDKTDHYTNDSFYLRPRLDDSTSDHFHRLLQRPPKRQDYKNNDAAAAAAAANSFLLPGPAVPTLQDNVEVKKNSAWSGPPLATICPERKLLHARCA
jgi:hypothetical protein